MPHSNYKEKLTLTEVLKLFKDGKYLCDLDTGQIFNSQGHELATKPWGKDGEYLAVKLYAAPKRRDILVAWVVWMVGNNRTLPQGFQVHHDDRDTHNNAFSNLFALTEKDHDKAHGRNPLLSPESDDEVPF